MITPATTANRLIDKDTDEIRSIHQRSLKILLLKNQTKETSTSCQPDTKSTSDFLN